MHYLNTMLLETFGKTASARIPNAYPEDPKISVIDENWQRSKFNILGITFESTFKHHLILLGGHLEIMNHRRQRLL